MVVTSTELYSRAGKDERAQKQAAVNGRLAKAVEALARRSCDGTDPGEAGY